MENTNKNTNFEDQGQEDLILPQSKAALLKKILNNLKEGSEQALKLLGQTEEAETRLNVAQFGEERAEGEILPEVQEMEGAKVIEGIFDGESMVGPDGKVYSVPANYASKSRLVEGDTLKLTIAPNGAFIYKQIGPVERARIVGKLEKEGEAFYVVSEGKRWRVLTASVTYYKGESGDEAVIIIPKVGESKWGSLENIIKING